MVKEEKWELRLYVAGQTPKSILALKNITKYCKEHLGDIGDLSNEEKVLVGLNIRPFPAKLNE